MQSASSSRSSKRSATDSSNGPPQQSAGAIPQASSGVRTSSGSSKSSTYRRQNPSQQLSQIEKSVTHLLVATKQLLETLTQWSRHNATEGEVSDVYVRLGYEFNIACRAFNGIGVDTSDLGPVPELLRAILEETLSQEASSASLDRFLPRIRDIIITLLHGLKRKQQRLRAKQAKDSQPNGNGFAASASSSSLNTGLTQMLEDNSPRRSVTRGSEKRTGSGSTLTGDAGNSEYTNGDDLPSNFPSATATRQNADSTPYDMTKTYPDRTGQHPFSSSTSDSSITNPAHHLSSGLPTPNEDERADAQRAARPVSQRDQTPFFQPPPPPPKQQDALAALQRGGDLERRASRRYSAYQISKHLGASPNGMPMLPPAQTTPVPNRGRDVRDSMNAVRTRGSGVYTRQKSVYRAGESSPARSNHLVNRISEESVKTAGSSDGQRPGATEAFSQTFGENERKAHISPEGEVPQMEATITSPIQNLPAYDAATYSDADPGRLRNNSSTTTAFKPPSLDGDQATQQFVPETSPQPGKELTMFLQYKSKIKKFVLLGGSNDLSIARLQLAFIERFQWNPHNNGNDLPEIYVQDPVSGVRHELEDLRDVKDRCVLVLNVEPLDEVKKHIDEGLSGIRRLVEGVRTAVDGQQLSLQRVSDRQQDTSREVARLSLKPDAHPAGPTSASKSTAAGVPSHKISALPADHADRVHSLRQELAVVRQTFTGLVSDMNSSMANVQEKAASVKTMAVEGVMPTLDASTGRSYVNTGKKALGEESERIVNQVDDLQDIVEDLRKDVVTRGVRPLPRQLENVSKSISNAAAELKKMQEYLRREKPLWTKIWEKELEVVCNDRDLLTMQEELAADLEDDLEKATQTFALVEQATKQQNLQASQGTGTALRSTSRGLAAIANNAEQDIDPKKARDGVLGEVRGLRPNHETRLEAIERAEKARQRQLEGRKEGEFSKEIAAFVEEGRLKKSGGVEETERQRKARDERNMREAWVKQQERAAGKGKEQERMPGPVIDPDETSEPLEPELGSLHTQRESVEHMQPDLSEQKPNGDAGGHAAEGREELDSPSKRSSWLPSIFTS